MLFPTSPSLATFSLISLDTNLRLFLVEAVREVASQYHSSISKPTPAPECLPLPRETFRLGRQSALGQPGY